MGPRDDRRLTARPKCLAGQPLFPLLQRGRGRLHSAALIGNIERGGSLVRTVKMGEVCHRPYFIVGCVCGLIRRQVAWIRGLLNRRRRMFLRVIPYATIPGSQVSAVVAKRGLLILIPF